MIAYLLNTLCAQLSACNSSNDNVRRDFARLSVFYGIHSDNHAHCCGLAIFSVV